jgi:hypothetical protein
MQSTGSYNENSLEEIPPEADLQQVVVDDDHLGKKNRRPS